MFFSSSARQSGIKSKIAPYVHALLFIGALSTPLQAADIMDIYHEALENDAQFRAARFTHQAAQEKLPQGRAGLLPTVTLAGVRRRQWIDIEKISGTGTATGTGVAARPSEVVIDNQSLTITATQPIYRKENFAIYEQSKLQVRRPIRSSSLRHRS